MKASPTVKVGMKIKLAGDHPVCEIAAVSPNYARIEREGKGFQIVGLVALTKALREGKIVQVIDTDLSVEVIKFLEG